MKLLQGRKKIIDGSALLNLTDTGIGFKLYDHAFDTAEIIHKSRDLKDALSNLDFLQICAASGFHETKEFGLFKPFNNLPIDPKTTYIWEEVATVDCIFKGNLLYLFSFGAIAPGRYVFYSEGVWELFPIMAVSLFKYVTGNLDDLNLKELVNQQDLNRPVFAAVYNILKPHQQEEFTAFNDSAAAKQYREHRDATIPIVDFKNLPVQLDNETLEKIVRYEQDAPLRYILLDLLSENHKGQVARYQWNLYEQEKAAKRALMSDAEKQKEEEWWDNYNADTTPQFFGNMGEPDTVEGYIDKYGVDPRVGRTIEMDLQELHDKLIASGYYSFYIDIAGIGGPENSDVEMLGFSDGVWKVYYSERGCDSEPFFTTTDKYEAFKFYTDRIRRIQHRHFILFTHSPELLQEYKDRLESADIKCNEDYDSYYKPKGDQVYHLFVVNADIFAVRNIFPVVPYYDLELRRKSDLEAPLLTSEQVSENIPDAILPIPEASEPEPIIEKEESDDNTDQTPPIAENKREPTENLVAFYEDGFSITAAHNLPKLNKDFGRLLKAIVIVALITGTCFWFGAGEFASMPAFLLTFLILSLIYSRWRQDTGKPALKITKEGLFINQQFLRNAFVSWDDVRNLQLKGTDEHPVLTILFRNTENLVKSQPFLLRSSAEANLRSESLVISSTETEGDLKQLHQIMQDMLKLSLPDVQTIPYDNSPMPVYTFPGYPRLEDKLTRTYFRQIVSEALHYAEEEYNRQPDFPFHESFYNQLKDIQKTVIEENVVYTQNQAYKRYPMSTMAVKNFEDDPRLYIKQISDIVWGIALYPKMPEE